MSDDKIAAIPGVESFIVTPENLGTGLRISIARPSVRSPQTEESAVVFVTDADICFGTVVDASRLGHLTGEVGSAIIVGIGYAEERGDCAFASMRRGLDFYRGPRRAIEFPTGGSAQLGGADVFLAALLNTVVPEIERRDVKAKAKRILFGTSAGGHFAAYVLTQRPDAFQGYAMMSPALVDFPPAPGSEQMVEAVRSLPPGTIPRGTSVFLSAGSLEEEPGEPLASASIISNIYRMRSALAVHGVATQLAVFANETHVSVPGAAIARALRFLVPPPSGTPSWQAALPTPHAES